MKDCSMVATTARASVYRPRRRCKCFHQWRRGRRALPSLCEVCFIAEDGLPHIFYIVLCQAEVAKPAKNLGRHQKSALLDSVRESECECRFE